MSKLMEYISSQCGNPRGIVGKVCCMVMNKMNQAMYKRTVSLVDVEPGEKVLDIGYGNGYLLRALDQKKNLDLYGVDISNDMRLAATKRNRKADAAGRLHLSVGDCCDLIFKDETFAAVTSINTIYFWSDTVKGLSEIRRVLKPKVCFYNVVYRKEYLDTLKFTESGFKKFEPKMLVELGRQAGFRKICVKTIVKGKSYVVIYKK